MTRVAQFRAAGPGRQATAGLPLPPVTPATPVTHRANVIRIVLIAAVWSLPMLRPAGPGNTGPADLVLAVSLIACALWLSGHGRLARFPYAAPVGLAILAGALASTAVYTGGYVSIGGGLLTLGQDVFVWILAVAIASVGQEPALIRTVTRAWAISATCWAALMIIGVFGHISLLSGETLRDGTRAAFTLGDPNVAADYFVCSLLVLRAAQYPRRRVLRWICCAVIVTAVALTGSNGGVLALALATALGGIFRLAKHRGLAPAILAAAAITLGGALIVPHISMQTIVLKAQASLPLLKDSIGRQAESSGSRSMILSETATLYFTADTPLGIGTNSTKSDFQAHQYAYVKEAHDDYAAALVERGLLGGIALILLLLMIGARCLRIASRPLRPAYADIIPRPELLGAAAISVFISALFYQVMHFRHVWMLFGLIAALDLWGRADRGGQRPEVPG
jgi:O-antigen ligase/polysaccharide polymerase Wzy-like membrane protein